MMRFATPTFVKGLIVVLPIVAAFYVLISTKPYAKSKGLANPPLGLPYDVCQEPQSVFLASPVFVPSLVGAW